MNQSIKNCFKRIRKEKEKYRADGDLDNRRTERTPWKCFRCGSEDHLIAKFPNPPKYNEKQRKQVLFNEKGNRAYDNGKNNSDQNIYASMGCYFAPNNTSTIESVFASLKELPRGAKLLVAEDFNVNL